MVDNLQTLSDAYQRQYQNIRRRMEKFGLYLWESMPNYRDEAVEKMVEQLLPVIISGQISLQELTNAYLENYAAAIGLHLPIAPVDTSLVAAGLRGVDPKKVYQRPAGEVYKNLAAGQPIETAARRGGLRLLQIIGGDALISRNVQAHRSMRQWKGNQYPQYYRRTLTGLENCALCTVASTQRYKVSKVMPIHPGCDCGFEPLPPGEYDWVIDDETLEAAHAAVEDAGFEADRSAKQPDYRKLIIVHEHSEYGPVMSLKRKNI